MCYNKDISNKRKNGGDIMFDGKYSKFLTGLLVVAIIAIIGLIGFFGYDMYRKYSIDKSAEEFIDQYEGERNIAQENVIANNVENTTNTPVVIDPGQSTQTNSITGGGSGTKKTPTYKGFNVVGTIEIPKTGIKYPVLEKVTPKSLEASVALFFGPGLNEIGNNTIAGHNYRNGAFFGKNKQLAKGDIIYITDNSGKKLRYTIYNIYVTDPDDSTYMTRDTNGKREISLTTCTDDSKQRLIIWAKE